MVKSNRVISKNLLFRLKKVQAEEIYKGLALISACEEISAINKIIDSPSLTPMRRGHYFLTEKHLLDLGLPYDETKVPLYIAGNNPKGMIVYLTPRESKQDLYDVLVDLRSRKKEKARAA